MSLLELKNISKYYKLKGSEKVHVLRDINLSFSKNELVSIIGESGSGKSTLMNLIGGLDSDYLGELFVDGEDIRKFRKKQLDRYRKNKVGFVFQSFNLIPHLSVLDNVTIVMTLSNVKKKERVIRAKEMLSKLGLENHIYKKPNQLSGGQKQRVAIARALINDPDIIIADEPTGSLDSKTTEQILKILKEIAERGKLVIMVTHSEKVAASSSRVIKIADGSIVDDNEFLKLENNITIEKSYKNKSFKNRTKQGLNIINAIKLALINMKEKLTRNIFISLGASIGIMSLILMFSFGNGVKSYFNKTMNSYVNPLVVEVNMPSDEDETVNLDVAAIQKPSITNQKPFKEEDIENLSKIENAASVEKGFNEISIGANSLNCNGKGSNVMRISTISSSITKANIEQGTLPKDGEILINKAVMDKIGTDVIGKKATLHILLSGKVVNKDFIISGIYTTAGGDLSAIMKSVFINYSDLEKIYSDSKVKFQPNVMYINTTSDKYTAGIKQKVKELGYSESSEEELMGMFNQMINILTYVLSGIAGISLVVSTIMIVVVMYISVTERTKEIGIMKAIGARGKDIRRIFMCESFLIGFFSGIIGIAFTIVLMKNINVMSTRLFGINLVVIKKSYGIFGLALSSIISTLAGLFPANKAAGLDPVEALRRE